MTTKFMLHIGLMKTGSTALQKTLSRSYDLLLKSGILYPKACRVPRLRHLQLAWSCVPDDLTPFAEINYDGKSLQQNLDTIFEEVEKFSPPLCLISAEEFSLWPAHCFKKLITALENVSIITYLRPQAELIESLYRQFVTYLGITTSFDTFFENCLTSGKAGQTQLNYDIFLEEWAELIGRDNIQVFTYNSDAKKDIVNHFLASLDVSVSISNKPNRSNTSLDVPYLNLLKVANESLSQPIRNKFLKVLTDFAASNPLPQTYLCTNAQKRHVVEAFEDSNNEVAQKYTNGKVLFDQ